MKKEIVDVAELSVIYLSYDEPQKEEFWAQISAMVPWAKRVDGVEGSDAAHKAAADASDTDRFILIDGDNMPDENFFNQQLVLTEESHNKVFRWKARNIINDLTYGNGGLSCWTKEFVYNMKTHENSLGDDITNVEFCWDENYWAMHDTWSVTYPNQTPFQAWRAGFREGVKMCLDRGVRLTSYEVRSMNKSNLRNLSVWHNIGADVENGFWAMLGAREGTHKTVLQPEWDHRVVQDFGYLKQAWNEWHSNTSDEYERANFNRMGNELMLFIGLDIIEANHGYSTFFKKFNAPRINLGIMVREGMIDNVVRSL